MKKGIFLMTLLFLFFISVIVFAHAEIRQQRINFVLDQTKNVPWEANTGWIEIPNSGVRIRSYAFATSSILKYQFPVIFTLEYNPNEVYAGGTFTVGIKIEAAMPVANSGLYLTGVHMPNSSYSLESRLGSEVKLQYNYQDETGDLYAPVDAAINIQKAFKTLLKNESQEARDSVPYLNLVPEINTAGLGLKAKIAYGVLKLASPSLELFGGLKLEGKYVSAKVAATGSATGENEQYFNWTTDGQVVYFTARVHPQAKLNSIVKISLSDLSYRFNLFRQMGMTLTVAGLKANTPQDVWESIGEILINGPAFSFEIPVVPGPPTSKVNPLPEKVNSLSFNVSWNGNSEARTYTIQYRVFKPASSSIPASWTNWKDWLVDTPMTSATFTVPSQEREGCEGNIYYFRSRAKNANNQWEAEHPQPDAFTKIALLYSVSGKVKDNNNNPIPGARVFISDLNSAVTDNAGNYSISGLSPGNYTVKAEYQNWTFSPAFKSVNLDKDVANIDFIGSPPAPVSMASSQVNPLPNTQKSTSFNVSWSGANAIAYDVQYKDGATGIWKDWVTNTNQTSKIFTGANNHTYYFRCRAKDQNGIWEEYSNVPDTFTAISTSYGLRIKETTPTSIKLEWDPVTTAQGFNRYEVHKTNLPDQYFGSNNSTLYMNLNSASATTCTVTNLQPRTTYYFIIAYVSSSIREYSEIQSATTSGGQATSKINSLPAETHFPNFAMPPNPAYLHFTVKWTGNKAVAYDVQYKIELSGQWTDWLAETTQTEAIFPPPGVNLLHGKTYYFRCRAKDSYGLWEDYPSENEGDAHTKIVISKATTFIKPLPRIQNSKSFTVSWEGIGAVSYNVQYKKEKSGQWVNWLTNTTLKSKEFTGVDGATYYFRCCGKDSEGNWAAYPPEEAIDTYTTVSLSNTAQGSSSVPSTSTSTAGSDTMEGTVDLTLLSLGLSTQVKGKPIEIIVRIKNNSKVALDGCFLEITADDGFQEKKTISIKENSVETVRIEWKPKRLGKIEVMAEIKAPEKIKEKNLKNNALKKQFLLK
ncbi:MAG: carboxypeptidase regulatory-like domain-containing protein [Candidatus Saccharicenans sp.]